MTTDLIRHPVAVNHYQWEVCDSDNKIIASCDGKETAAEIVRILNLHHEGGNGKRLCYF